jgi:hypothetical protein
MKTDHQLALQKIPRTSARVARCLLVVNAVPTDRHTDRHALPGFGPLDSTAHFTPHGRSRVESGDAEPYNAVAAPIAGIQDRQQPGEGG